MLFEFYLCASSFELGFDFCSFVLGSGFFDCLRSTLNEVLSVLQAKTSDRTHFLDHIDLGGTDSSEDDVKFSLFLGRATGVTTTVASDSTRTVAPVHRSHVWVGARRRGNDHARRANSRVRYFGVCQHSRRWVRSLAISRCFNQSRETVLRANRADERGSLFLRIGARPAHREHERRRRAHVRRHDIEVSSWFSNFCAWTHGRFMSRRRRPASGVAAAAGRAAGRAAAKSRRFRRLRRVVAFRSAIASK